eukprot:1144104-Pelagomonas_calceolata.AAC.2
MVCDATAFTLIFLQRSACCRCAASNCSPGLVSSQGVMYRIYANVLKDLMTDRCIQKNKVPDTQFGFYSSRSTLHPLFILRHLRHAAKKFKPRQSPRLHAAFIDFSQAYGTVP